MRGRREFAIAEWRFQVLGGALLVLLLLLVWRLFHLQVLDTERGFRFLQRQGDARAVRTVPIPAHRGIIEDRHGEPLAVSTPVLSLSANPQELAAAVEEWPALAASVGITPAQLQQRIGAAGDREFMYLRRRMNPAEAERAMALKVPGVDTRREYQRFYPAADVTAHIVGFTNVDDHGQEGIELAYDDWLAGVEGAKQIIKDRNHHLIRDVQELQPAHPGRDIRLSIDLRIQYLAFRELKNAVQAAHAESATIVVLDARSGEVLAMANLPSYNPNRKDSITGTALRNRAITDLFEPGSTVKPFTIMAGLESGKYTADTLIDTAPGYIRVGRKTFRDHHNIGLVPLTTVIAKSSQVGTTKVALSLEQSAVRDAFQRAGFGQSLGTGFPGESVGLLPNYARWSDVARANFAFGYGLSVSPLQLARAYLTLANGGLAQEITLIKRNETPEGERRYAPEKVRELVKMMEAVILPGGTAVRAAIPGYSVAGKTGTVHRLGAGGYEADRYISLFAGFAPVDDPRVVSVVIVNDPRGGVYYGGAIAAPVFSAVVRGALRLLNVAPDRVPETRVATRTGNGAPA